MLIFRCKISKRLNSYSYVEVILPIQIIFKPVVLQRLSRKRFSELSCREALIMQIRLLQLNNPEIPGFVDNRIFQLVHFYKNNTPLEFSFQEEIAFSFKKRITIFGRLQSIKIE